MLGYAGPIVASMLVYSECLRQRTVVPALTSYKDIDEGYFVGQVDKNHALNMAL
jgi:hypothetical protein